ncbi:MAG TPA: DUF3747 domain-containing protein [Allocoleopsis sp.]
MNISQWFRVAVLTTASFVSFSAWSPTTAATFDNIEVSADKFVAVAAPYGDNKYQLLIVEQVSSKRPCWSESGSNPVQVEPLLLNFNFTGICDRKTDSNGYSIRMNGQDLGLDYLIRVVERNGELVLVGTPRVNRQAPEIEIGSTKGHGSGFEKIFLNPGWRFTRRVYQGKPLGHIYLTSDSDAPVASGSNTTPQPLPPSSQPSLSNPQPLPPSSSPSLSSPQPLPPAPTPQRELIFTKPDAGSAAPSVPTPTPSSPTQPSGSSSTPDRQIPVFVVPTN